MTNQAVPHRRPSIAVLLGALVLAGSPAQALVQLQGPAGYKRQTALGADVLVGNPRILSGPAGVVRQFDGTTGALVRTFDDPDPASHRRFGYDVAVVGGNVLIGAPGEINEAPGAAYLFDGVTGALLQTYLPPTSQTNDAFGYAVADFGGNVLVGAPGFAGGPGVGAGNEAVYLFDATTAALIRTFTNPFPPAASKCPAGVICPDFFGAALAVLGGNIAVGTPEDAVMNDDERGSAYIVDGTTGALLHTLTSPSSSVHVFGSTLAASGTSLVVGAPGRISSGGGTDRGATYLYDGTTGALVRTFVNPQPGGNDRFGDSLAFLGSDVLVSSGGNAAYRFDATTGTLVNAFYLSTRPVTVVSGHPVVGRYVYDDAPAPGDHYMCDAAAVNARAGGVPFNRLSPPTRTLTDRYGAETCRVPKEQFVCPPAEKNLEGPPANPSIHQVEYQLRCPAALVPITGVVALDQFHPGGVVVDLTKKVNLLVPSGKIDLGPVPGAPPQPVPPAPPANVVDHFLCYKVRLRSLTAVVPPFPVDVRDQFYPAGYPGLGLIKLVKLCTPADKDGEDPTAPTHPGYLACYKGKLAAGTPFAKTNVSTNNLNFGAQVLGVKAARELCVPAIVP